MFHIQPTKNFGTNGGLGWLKMGYLLSAGILNKGG